MRHTTDIHGAILRKRSDMTSRSKSKTCDVYNGFTLSSTIPPSSTKPTKNVPEAKLVERPRYKTWQKNSWAHNGSCVGLSLTKISNLFLVFRLLRWGLEQGFVC